MANDFSSPPAVCVVLNVLLFTTVQRVGIALTGYREHVVPGRIQTDWSFGDGVPGDP